jgi:RNA polymerase sigma-70 factor (ECF subfamily)
MNGIVDREPSSGTGSNGDGSAGSSMSLLDRVRAHDPAAWRQLVDLYGPLIGYWCRRAGLQAADVADVTQAVFMSVARQLPDFRATLSNQVGSSHGEKTPTTTNSSPGESQASSPATGRRSGLFLNWLSIVTRRKLIDWRRSVRPDQAQGGSSAVRRLHAHVDPLELEHEAFDEVAAFESPVHSDGELSRVWSGVVSRGLEQIRPEFHAKTWAAFWRTVIDGQATSLVAAELGLTPASIRQAKSRILRRLRQQLGDL